MAAIYWAKWVLIKAVGFSLAAAMGLRLLVASVLRPCSTFARRDWEEQQFPSPVPGVTHELLDVGGGIRIHAVRTGEGMRAGGGGAARPIMLCVHGFPEYWGSWRRQMEAFRDRYDVVAIDMRGYGQSSKPEGVEAYTLPKLAGDLAGVVRALGADGAVLVAHDWGGAVAWAAAYLYPQLFSKLVVACAPHPRCFTKNMDFNQLVRSWYMAMFQVPVIPELLFRANDYAAIDYALLTGPMALRTPGALAPRDVDAYKRELARPGALTASINYYRALGRSLTQPADPELGAAMRSGLRVPTLLVWASEDAALGPQLLRGTERYVDSLKVHVVQGSSHWVQQDKWEEFNHVVAGFLEENGGTGKTGTA